MSKSLKKYRKQQVNSLYIVNYYVTLLLFEISKIQLSLFMEVYDVTSICHPTHYASLIRPTDMGVCCCISPIHQKN